MAQFARPDTDTTVGSYTDQGGGATTIYASIDESVVSDADYIRSVTSPSSSVYVCRLSDITDPALSTGHVMRMRTACDQDSQETLTFTQELRQGYVNEGAQGTLIATQSRSSISSSVLTTSSYTLSAAEADAITNYADLFFRFSISVV